MIRNKVDDLHIQTIPLVAVFLGETLHPIEKIQTAALIIVRVAQGQKLAL